MSRPMVPLIDISRHQGAVDFNVMRSRGVGAVIIRLGNGKTPDPLAATYVRNARDAEMIIGGYWFCNPKADPRGDTQMARFAQRAEELDCLDLPPMMDIESYVNEAGTYPVISGRQLQSWLEDGAEQLRDEFNANPLVYSNAAYYNSQHMVAGGLGNCPIIVARYPWYYAGAPAPPPNGALWEPWLFGSTTKRPQVPPGFDGWQGWQFSAGYNRQGPVYGCSSSDLDLNLIKADAYDELIAWRGAAPQPAPLPPHPDTPDVVQDPVHAILEDDMNFYLATVTDGPAQGLGLVVRLVIGDDGAPHHKTYGFLDQKEMDRWRGAGAPEWHISGDDFADLQATKI